jgi:hypothetical protein
VRAGVVFRGPVRFENLADEELGALLAALDLPKGAAHKLGMARPLGLGSIRIQATLRIQEPALRYSSWEADGLLDPETTREKEAHCRERFEAALLEHARASGETLLPGGEGLRRIARLDALFTLLDWEGRPAAEETRYLQIQNGDASRYPVDRQGKVNEYRSRPVLPTPHAVAGRPEPAWPTDPPRPAPPEGALETRRRGPRAPSAPGNRPGGPTFPSRPGPGGAPRPGPAPARAAATPIKSAPPPPPGVPRDLQVLVETFSNRTRGNLGRIVERLEGLSADGARTELARGLLKRAEALPGRLNPEEQACLDRVQRLVGG